VSADPLTTFSPKQQAEQTAVARVRQVWQTREQAGTERLVAAEVARELGVSESMTRLTLRALRAQRASPGEAATVYDRIERLYRTRERAGGQHLGAAEVAAEVGTTPRVAAGTLYVLRTLDRDGPSPTAQQAANRARIATSP
jgi:hypothetical protein